MVLYSNDKFLSSLTRLFKAKRPGGSVFMTVKRYTGVDPRDVSERGHHKQKKGADDTGTFVLLRVTDGRKEKFSTIVSNKELERFQKEYHTLLKASMDGLKRREKTDKKHIKRRRIERKSKRLAKEAAEGVKGIAM